MFEAAEEVEAKSLRFAGLRDESGCPNLPGLLEDRMGNATRYACGHWAMHVKSSPTTDDFAVRLIDSASEFFKNNAVPWIEVMSLENRLESIVHSIHDLFDWLAMVRT